MNLDGKITNPGELRTQVTLLKSSITKVSGGQKVTWSVQAKAWCKWINAHGSEGISGESVQAAGPATVLIRYYAGMDASGGVLKGWFDTVASDAEVYRLMAPPDNIRERNEYMELQVQLVKGSA